MTDWYDGDDSADDNDCSGIEAYALRVGLDIRH